MFHRFRIVNVFTCGEDRFSGNPLAVFEDGRGLDDRAMQQLALQFNLSETTFILPASTAEADAQVRIFTPAYEMPFAGHPTLGTAHVVDALAPGRAELRLQTRAGVIPVARRGRRWQLRANAPRAREAGLSHAELGRLLGLDPAQLAGEARWVDTGNEQLLIPLRSAQAVRAVQVDGALLAAQPCAHGNPKVYVFAETAEGSIYARFFFMTVGVAVLEDPATGSACANLGGYFLTSGAARPLSRVIRQGEQVGRPSTLYLDLDEAGQILVGGEVIELGAGAVEV